MDKKYANEVRDELRRKAVIATLMREINGPLADNKMKEKKASLLYYFENILKNVPKGIKLTNNVKDLKARKKIIKDKLKQLKSEKDRKKIQSLARDIESSITSYNMLYDIIRSHEWDPNAPSPEF
jgi:ABC-type phosphate transport system auxiliary subunit